MTPHKYSTSTVAASPSGLLAMKLRPVMVNTSTSRAANGFTSRVRSAIVTLIVPSAPVVSMTFSSWLPSVSSDVLNARGTANWVVNPHRQCKGPAVVQEDSFAGTCGCSKTEAGQSLALAISSGTLLRVI